ncbi:carbohydrate ABC transporter permease [Streptomyces sp. NPDC127098]|uniref:carbohydrate ABC transporter permease n=1 Tax=Streptomyces sp. NPDC127098 TaxID=3347137 RepID=UPI0036697D46
MKDTPRGQERLTPRDALLFTVAFLVPPRFTPDRVRRDRRYRKLDQRRFIAWFLALPLLVYAVFVVSPFLQAFFYSLTDWTGYSATYTFTGLENYQRMLEDDKFWESLVNSLLLLVIAPLVTLSLGLFLAYMLNVGGRRGGATGGVAGARFYKVVYFFPQVLSIAVIAIIWARIYSPTGLLNEGLGAVGLGSLEREDWLGGDVAVLCVLAVLCWAFVGFYVVLFSAAMSSVPGEIYEAALLDGAGRSVTFFRITLPLTWDTVRTGWIYMGIQALDSFALVDVMVPEHGMDVLPSYLFEKAFRDAQAGYATAIGVALFLVTLVFALLMMLVGRRERIEL